MRAIEICCVGELMWDIHVPPGQSLEHAEHLRRRPGGAAANVALRLARASSAGAEDEVACGVAGVLSDDPFGHGLCEALQRRGVDASAVIHVPGRTGLVFIEHQQEERFLSYRPHFESYPTRIVLPEGFTGRGLHIAALNPEPAELKALAVLAREVRALGGWVVVDLNARPRPWRPITELPIGFVEVLRAAHIIKASSLDLAVLSSCGANLHELLSDAVAQQGALIVTAAAEVTTACGGWGALTEQPPSLAPNRTIGAGDAFCSGMLRVLLGGQVDLSARSSYRVLLRAGHAAAAEHLLEPLDGAL